MSMPGKQAEDTDETYDCPLCEAFVKGEIEEAVWKYIAVVAKDHRPRRVMARVTRNRFDIDVTTEQVAEHIDNNHSDRRNYQ